MSNASDLNHHRSKYNYLTLYYSILLNRLEIGHSGDILNWFKMYIGRKVIIY